MKLPSLRLPEPALPTESSINLILPPAGPGKLNALQSTRIYSSLDYFLVGLEIQRKVMEPTLICRIGC